MNFKLQIQMNQNEVKVFSLTLSRGQCKIVRVYVPLSPVPLTMML